MTTLVWFTHDLRLHDQAALHAALERGEDILPVYLAPPASQHSEPCTAKPNTSVNAHITSQKSVLEAQPSGAALWWLHHSLSALNQQIKQLGGELLIHQGEPQSLIALAQKYQCQHIHFSHSHEPWLQKQQKQLNTLAQQHGITCKQFGGQLLNLPAGILNKQGNPFQVFTPYYRACLAVMGQPTALDTQALLKKAHWKPHSVCAQTTLESLNWLPTTPNWAKDFGEHWEPGEQGAHKRLKHVLNTLNQYTNDRDTPGVDGTSCLAAHLRFGEISPRFLWQHVSQAWPQGEAQPFLRQLVWRDFSYYLLHHYPHITQAPFKPTFTHFPWQNTQTAAAQQHLKRWQQGLTGYPLVDAGMRQLWQTGWMHNRVRMVVASFLTKHLQIHWMHGANWFWDTLLDADQANNTAGWQWVAGCGADAAPYFRIFNPITQSEKFDGSGDYIRQYIPELAALPNKYIHTPWLAPEPIISAANITLGKDYPVPIVDHKTARETALNAYAITKQHQS